MQSTQILSDPKCPFLPGIQTIEEHKAGEIKDQKAKEFSEFEIVAGKDLYTTLTDCELLCGPQVWKRVLREVKEVNDDFQSLRTCIGIVTDTIGALHFLLYPGDGAMADKPLCGRILIPKDYPNKPPVVHLLTHTNRGNVDIYRSYAEPDRLHHMHSSMCFDILKSRSNGGVWEPAYTLSALISSLLQAIVSINVLQEDGSYRTEFVSMEKLSSIHQSVEMTYDKYEDIMPTRKEIIHIEGMQLPTKYFKLPEKITSGSYGQDLIIKSDAIYLQVPSHKMKDNVYSIGFDLSGLKVNCSTVFAIILSNSPFDPAGKKRDTILVRNGVTATAAKKEYNRGVKWYYHGKPMNESDLKLIVTVGYNQFCISYADGDRQAIHGDRPVSFLTKAEIGNVGKEQFYLSVFLKNKGGPTVTVKTFMPKYGYVHPVAAESL